MGIDLDQIVRPATNHRTECGQELNKDGNWISLSMRSILRTMSPANP
jgi:hypothetical protein